MKSMRSVFYHKFVLHPIAKWHEMNTCENGDNTYYRAFLCTDKYHKS
jgi:hypothetical protein